MKLLLFLKKMEIFSFFKDFKIIQINEYLFFKFLINEKNLISFSLHESFYLTSLNFLSFIKNYKY